MELPEEYLDLIALILISEVKGMELKIWCEHCNGIGNWFERKRTISGVEEIPCECMFCGGNGYTDPPQEILDDLECVEIERRLVKKQLVLSNSYSAAQDEFCLEIYDPSAHYGMIFKDKTKLMTYKQAVARIEGSGQE